MSRILCALVCVRVQPIAYVHMSIIRDRRVRLLARVYAFGIEAGRASERDLKVRAGREGPEMPKDSGRATCSR